MANRRPSNGSQSPPSAHFLYFPFSLPYTKFATQTVVTHNQLSINTGVLFGVPIPESYEAIGERIQEAVEQAVAESEQNGMARRGKEVTPWLLKRVGELTEGKSLASSTCFGIYVCCGVTRTDERYVNQMLRLLRTPPLWVVGLRWNIRSLLLSKAKTKEQAYEFCLFVSTYHRRIDSYLS